MSSSYYAAIVVGLPYAEMYPDPNVDPDDELDTLEGDGVVRVPPYYDAPTSRCLIGIEVAATNSYSYAEWPPELEADIEVAIKRFGELTGRIPRVMFTTVGW